MRIAAEIERLAGVHRAALLVATPANRDVLAQAGLLTGPAVSAKPSDLIIAVAADEDPVAQAALARASGLLTAVPATVSARHEQKAPRTIAAALAELSGANLAMISTPGPYATAEALKALKRGLHVFLFSDNVPLADEIELKQLAVRKRLLVMGPDCGTAVLDGVPLGFSNAVRRGRIGLVSASGTGLQQVMCLVDRLGEGVSQAIGVGGHDLHERVGGLMMLAGLEHLLGDRETAVVVLISKPPAAAVARRVLDRAGRGSKPAVVCFLGGDPALIRSSGAHPAVTLEEAATRAVELASGRSMAEHRAGPGTEKLEALARAQARQLVRGQRAIQGLFSGGTLCAEAAVIVPGHPFLDLGDDRFTVGRPHPMIDFRLRNEYLQAAADDPATAVVLIDVVLGYGSHPDPAGELIPAIEQARARAGRAGRPFIVVGSVCGTPADPQDLMRQEARLEAAGVLLAPSNAAAARLTGLIVEEAQRHG
jgi:succinyl-CoA synthetase alpha subunit